MKVREHPVRPHARRGNPVREKAGRFRTAAQPPHAGIHLVCTRPRQPFLASKSASAKLPTDGTAPAGTGAFSAGPRMRTGLSVIRLSRKASAYVATAKPSAAAMASTTACPCPYASALTTAHTGRFVRLRTAERLRSMAASETVTVMSDHLACQILSSCSTLIPFSLSMSSASLSFSTLKRMIPLPSFSRANE